MAWWLYREAILLVTVKIYVKRDACRVTRGRVSKTNRGVPVRKRAKVLENALKWNDSFVVVRVIEDFVRRTSPVPFSGRVGALLPRNLSTSESGAGF